MRSVIGICIAVCCALVMVSSVAFANECPMGKNKAMPMRGKMSREMDKDTIFCHKASMALAKATELGLSADQIDKIKTLKFSVEKSVIKEDADIKSLALDIKEAIGAYISLKKILTPDQLKNFKGMCDAGMKGRHKEGKEKKGAVE